MFFKSFAAGWLKTKAEQVCIDLLAAIQVSS